MTDKQWLRHFLTRLQDPEFSGTVEWHLRAIRAAARANNVPARQSAAAAYGGFLAYDRANMRAGLAQALMRELDITTTQHVARHVLKTCFGQAMDSAVLDHWFSLPGRDASVKHMKDAKRALASRPDQQLRYAALYKWYCKAQAKMAHRIKHGRHPALRRRFEEKVDSRLYLAPQLQAAQHLAAGEAPQQKRFTRQLPLFGI